jgi:hypothetical protein
MMLTSDSQLIMRGYFNNDTNIQSVVINNSLQNITNIEVYPNPTNGIINISNLEDARITVVNILGEVVVEKNNTNGKTPKALEDNGIHLYSWSEERLQNLATR